MAYGRQPIINSYKFLRPLYITREHFERALPLIQRTLVELSPQGRRYFRPEMVLDVMPKVLNTMVVLLCDKGIQASECAIEGYCMLHRLFLALCEKYNLWKQAEQGIIEFQNRPLGRLKAKLP